MASDARGTMTFNSTFKSPGKGLERRTPLARTPFKTKPDAKGFSRTAPRTAFETPSVLAKPRSTLKTSRPKTTKIRQSARDEECTMRLPGVCNGRTDTTVWAHSNRSEDGKGIGLKAQDDRGAYACSCCHQVYDRQVPRPKGMTLQFVEDRFTDAMEESRASLERKGLVAPAVPT